MPRTQDSPDLFTCEICVTTFTRRADLQRHERVHAEDVEALKIACPYDGCFYRTLQKSNLKTHVTARHLKEKPHKCQYADCTHSFADGAALIRHERSRHGILRGKDKVSRGARVSLQQQQNDCRIILDTRLVEDKIMTRKEVEVTKQDGAKRSLVEKRDRLKTLGNAKGRVGNAVAVQQEEMDIEFTARKEDRASKTIGPTVTVSVLPISDSTSSSSSAASASPSVSSASPSSLSSSSPSSYIYSPPPPSYQTPTLDPKPSKNTLVPLSPVRSTASLPIIDIQAQRLSLPPIKDVFPDLFGGQCGSASASSSTRITSSSSIKQNGTYRIYGALDAPKMNWDVDSKNTTTTTTTTHPHTIVNGTRTASNRRHTFNTNYLLSSPNTHDASYHKLRRATWDRDNRDTDLNTSISNNTSNSTSATNKLTKRFNNMSFSSSYNTSSNSPPKCTLSGPGYSPSSSSTSDNESEGNGEDISIDVNVDIDIEVGSRNHLKNNLKPQKPPMRFLPIAPMPANFQPSLVTAGAYRHV